MPIQLDAKLNAFRRSSHGFFITLEIGPDSDWGELAAAPLGTAFGVAMVSYDPETGKRADKDLPTAAEVRGIMAPDKQRKSWDELKRAQRAGILCSDNNFQLWFGERIGATEPINCAEALRNYLGVHSRAALDDGAHDRAAFKFDALVADYRQWSGQETEQR